LRQCKKKQKVINSMDATGPIKQQQYEIANMGIVK